MVASLQKNTVLKINYTMAQKPYLPGLNLRPALSGKSEGSVKVSKSVQNRLDSPG